MTTSRLAGKVIEHLRGLNGGEKQMWLRQHRAEVMGYFIEHGADATMERYLMTADTLERFLHRDEVHIENFTKADRAVYISESAIDLARESARRCTQVEEQLAALMPVVQIVYALSKVLQMAAALPEPGDFAGKLQKRS